MATEQLEPQQYERMYWESDVPMNDLRVGLLGHVLGFFVALFAVLLIISATVRFPDQVELPVVLKSEQQNAIYTFPFNVYISRRYVHTGDTVQAGQLLLEITSPEIVQFIHQLNTQKAKEDKFNRADRIGYQKQRDIVQSGMAQNDVQIRAIQTELGLLEKNWLVDQQRLHYELIDADEKLARNRQLYADKVIAQVDFRQFEINQLKAKTALASAQIAYNNRQAALGSQLAGLQLAKTSSISNTDKIRADELSNLLQLQADYTNTRQMLANLFGNYAISNGNILIKSRIAGQVAYLFDGELEVKQSVTLLKISTQHSPNYGFTKCPPSLIGRIHQGQACYLKIASFPFYEWGSLRGKTTEISTAPDENGEFNVSVAFDPHSRMQPLLQTGLTGQAVIIIDNKTLLQYFFRSTAKTYHQFIKGNFIEPQKKNQ